MTGQAARHPLNGCDIRPREAEGCSDLESRMTAAEHPHPSRVVEMDVSTPKRVALVKDGINFFDRG